MIICIIPAKGGSRRLENKNMRMINGKPMLYYSIMAAKKSKKIRKIYVSTDSPEIADYGRRMGVDIIMRPNRLVGDAPVTEVYRHALRQINSSEISYVVGLQPDHPDRSVDLDKAIRLMKENGYDDLFSIDAHGQKNGSLRIIKAVALSRNQTMLTGTIIDDCTNVHTFRELLRAERRIKGDGGIITIGERIIGKNAPTFIVAEGANNHLGNIETAIKMIDAACNAGADAIKFQTFKAEHLVTEDAPIFWKMPGVSTQFEFYRSIDKFGKEEYRDLFAYAKEKGIICFSTPFDRQSASMLNELGVGIFKIASCDVPDLRLIRHIASFGKPMIISTGASELGELQRAVDTAYSAGNIQIALLVCTLSYPTKVSDANLRRITTLKKNFPEVVIGLSDHSEPEEQMVLPALAVALGARIIEKHFTLDRAMPGIGQKFSTEPNDFKKMIRAIRLAEAALGSDRIMVYETEKSARQNARRSLVAQRDIHAGEILREEMIGIKRPGGGLAADEIDQIIGKVVLCDMKKDTRFTFKILK
jgi:sialic acid synthase SpsE/GTP:adenosylcobinamide-phosphate guanylyltransferase